MNWDEMEGAWKQFTGSAKEKWGQFTDDNWTQLKGKKDQLVGKIQERYGRTKEQAEIEADEWARTQRREMEGQR